MRISLTGSIIPKLAGLLPVLLPGRVPELAR